ncbi:MAG: short-chain dehydrogenase [Sphingobacteriales bacterium 17-39-43]|uniref:SDR family oxidoreductase n=1 Tax=Daejeonella sp. TaxID=2805397 RepID=UPI000BD5E74C|nr:SDR family oxidoreductase [Daejeonella sp.]OYY05021.1 MAG: short-chain dehydrogenase [Sphingobacteriia bacterium 35-40-5]OYZ33457.1 MAG: short-chain dehydrogenase [Sphingobacteriales bacterium 16-39-50]OZA24500.1 MAG: short-chain dehydrogenase [Sphingobacteriales bacterium 17-39-43]HQT24241.1 SDR family oxidoreductase [Daejeonella sp.]HQT56684.1 SDR family oxidoreductase [Daejeonella sp.]
MNIVISGASSGVGFEAVLELIGSGNHKIIALARSEDKLYKLQEIAFALNPGCMLYTAKFDIVHDDYENGLIPFIKEKIGHVDILINNAGSLVNKPFMQLSQLDFAEMLQNNLLGHVKMIQKIVPLMPVKSHIVNIGSMGGFQGSQKFSGLSAYSASKSALHTLTECLAAEFSGLEIAVNCLALGSAQTEMLEKAFPDYQSPVMAFEMGKYIADFALSGHKFFNGKILPVAHSTP